jgi:triosephosphate isomerase (TIM)
MEKLIIANWKSNKSVESAQNWVRELSEYIANSKFDSDVATLVLAPSFPLLSPLAENIKENSLPITLGAQDVSSYPMGAYTGAVSAQSLQEYGVEYVLVGHSERRRHFHETDQDVALKVRQVLDAGMRPVLCIDEPYLLSQAAAIDTSVYSNLIIAYEPVAAIGTGQSMNVGAVQEMNKRIAQIFGEGVPVLYGGSVTEGNVAEYLLVADGALVGGASLEARDFTQVLAQL